MPRAHLALACLAAVLLLASASVGDPPAAHGKEHGRRARDHRPRDHERRGHVPSHREQVRFMWAMAGQESGWDYYARNRSSGAYGKYQIMPMNWPSWAEIYLGDRHADQTPWNQEKVAYGRIRDLYRTLGSWDRVAYWWLTGSNERRRKRWSDYAAAYVDKIAALRRRAPRDGSPMPRRTSSRVARGTWRVVDGRQVLRRQASGMRWPRGGSIASGSIVKVRKVRTIRTGTPWLRIVTVDGRLGWLRQATTMPARAPERPHRWRDVRDRTGREGADRDLVDRSHVRPRPR